MEKLGAADKEQQIDRWLLDTFFGLSPLVCRELAYRVCGATDGHIFALNQDAVIRFANEWEALLERIRVHHYEPTMIVKWKAAGLFVFSNYTVWRRR